MNNFKQKLCGIIGYPLAHTLSPIMHNSAFEAVGLDWKYLPFQVEQDKLKLAIKGLQAIGAVGVNVTMPYKEKVIPYLDEIAQYAKLVGAVNTIHFAQEKISGFNTDGRGFIDSIQNKLDFNPRDKTILLIGAGGAARAVAVSMAMEGVSSIVLANRTFENANNIKEIIDNHFTGCQTEVVGIAEPLNEYIANSDMIINATSVGMKGTKDEVPISLSGLKESQYVVDLIYSPDQTKFLEEASRAGAKTVNGLDMLVYQGAASFKIWTNQEAPVDIMKNSLIEHFKGDSQNG